MLSQERGNTQYVRTAIYSYTHTLYMHSSCTCSWMHVKTACAAINIDLIHAFHINVVFFSLTVGAIGMISKGLINAVIHAESVKSCLHCTNCTVDLAICMI